MRRRSPTARLELALSLLAAAALACGAPQRARADVAGELAVSEFVSWSCRAAGAEAWLPTTCLGATGDLEDLLRHLRVDIVLLPARVPPELVAELPPAEARRLRLVGAVLTAALNHGDLTDLAHALSAAGASSAVPGSPESCSGDAGLAACVLLRVLAVDRSTHPRPEQYAAAVQDLLLPEGALPDGALSAARRDALASLIAEIERHEQLVDQASSAAAEMVDPRRAGSMLRIVQHLRVVAAGERMALPVDQVEALVRAAMAEDLEAALRSALALLAPAAIPEGMHRALELGARLATVRSGEDAKAMIAAVLLPPWIGGLIFDFHASTPIATVDEFRVDFGGALGYESDRWGARASGGFRSYDSQLDGRDLIEQRVALDARGWFNTASLRDDALGLSIGGELGFDQYASDTTFFADGVIDEQISLLVRAGATLDVFGQPDRRTFFRIAAVVGGHREYFSQESIVNGALDRRETDELAGNYAARAVFVWRTMPGVLRTAVFGRLAFLGLTRSDALLSFDPDLTFMEQNVLTSEQRTEVFARLGVDLEALEIGDLLRPGVFAQLEHVSEATAEGSITATIPSVGVDVRSYVPD